jgi:hypothetical protein
VVEELVRILVPLVEEQDLVGEARGVLEEIRLLADPREIEDARELRGIHGEPPLEDVVVETRAGAGGLDGLPVEGLFAGAGLQEDRDASSKTMRPSTCVPFASSTRSGTRSSPNGKPGRAPEEREGEARPRSRPHRASARILREIAERWLGGGARMPERSRC